MKQKIAIIGAGLAGTTVANALSKITNVTLYEKSRGFGGRMATRTRGDFQFDHGAQYFTAKGETFKQCIIDGRPSKHTDIHRWRYANAPKQHGPKAFLDKQNQLAACGDWCIEGRVESAFNSANSLIKALHQTNAI